MSTYNPPKWTKAPNANWRLDEIKSGVIVNSYALEGIPLVIFGRTPTAAVLSGTTDQQQENLLGSSYLTITTAHESCSRLHARIAFDSSGIPWLRDLGSGNGTKVNKKELPKKSIGKVENLKGEGSRGVVLYPGDVIQFGASTRVYVLDGPSDFHRGSMKAMLQQPPLVPAASREYSDSLENIKSPTNSSQEDGITWGISLEEEEEQEYHDYDTTTDDGQKDRISWSSQDIGNIIMSKSHKKLYDKIQAKRYKLTNIQNEMNRIQSKASSMELTLGQTKQLESLEQRENKLLQELSELETTLKDMMQNTKNGSDASQKRKLDHGKDENYNGDDDDDDDDVDGFFDRTSESHKRNKIYNVSKNIDHYDERKVETEESLIAQCEGLLLQFKSAKKRVAKTTSKRIAIQNQINAMAQEDEEYFFMKNDLDLALDEQGKAKAMVDSLAVQIDEIEKLLKVVNKSIMVDRDLLFVGHRSQYEKLIKSTQDDHYTIAQPSINTSQPKSQQEPERQPQGVLSQEMLMPPPSLPRPVSTPTTRDSDTTDSPEYTAAPYRKIRGPQLPARSTLDYLRHESTSVKSIVPPSLTANDERERIGNTSSSSLSPPIQSHTVKDDAYDTKTDHWVAPSGQDGSGFTRLNQKFQGRY